MNRVILKTALFLGISSLLIFSLIKLDAAKTNEGVDAVTTDNYANKRLEFYYYIPSSIINKNQPYPLLICVPGLSGKGEKFIGEVFKDFAEQEKFIIISPSFMWDEDNWDSRRSYQYPSVWSGDALLRIVEAFKKKQGLFLSKFYLYGFSAGAQFALRFALWKPELCAACAVYGNGGTVIPRKKVAVKFYVSVGKEDKTRIANTEEFYTISRRLGIDVKYKQYNGGHRLPAEHITDSLTFFTRGNMP